MTDGISERVDLEGSLDERRNNPSITVDANDTAAATIHHSEYLGASGCNTLPGLDHFISAPLSVKPFVILRERMDDHRGVVGLEASGFENCRGGAVK